MSIKHKIEAIGTPLKDWDIQINYGIKTGYNDAFIISTEKRDEILSNCQTSDERHRTEELIRPILRGRDIKRYGYNWAELWLIATFPSKHYDIEEYPAVKRHLLSFAENDLRKARLNWVADSHLADFCMQKLSQTGKLVVINGQHIYISSSPEKARKKTNNKWFETQDSISYWEDFFKQKICYSEIVQEPKFYLDSDEHFFPEATTFLLTGKNLEYLYVLLHSKSITYFFRTFYAGGGLGESGYRYKKVFLENLPIPLFEDKEVQKQIVELASRKPDYTDTRINKLIYKMYQFNKEEIQFIENQ